VRPYDYARRDGVHEVSWDEFARLARRLAELLEPEGIDVVIGLARAGLLPATVVASSLRTEFSPLRLSRRVDDEVTHATPRWRVPLRDDLRGKVVAVVDEIADTGETLGLAAAAALERGAVRVVTATLFAHTWADPLPDHCALVTDELLLFPWDREVLVDGAWVQHPELRAALEAQPED
jgi:hypoxanthine phosphoribosyltransferase